MNVNFDAGGLSDPGRLSVSIVVYYPDVALLAGTLDTLAAALCAIGGPQVRLTLVDNGGSPDLTALTESLALQRIAANVITGHGNVGYGAGHNLAIARAQSDFHLILNPDVELSPDALARALAYLREHPDVGLLTPWIGDEAGRTQFLCRRMPTVFDLFVRGFLPRSLRTLFTRRLARYEMRDIINDRDVVNDPPIVSGCCMLFRTDVLKRLGGFDERYFLYFEDYDLSLRTHDVARIAYVPSVRIVHHGGGASRKGWTHIRLFVASMAKFFNRFGWKWL